MSGPWITPDDLLSAIAQGLKYAKADLKGYWTDIAARCVPRGYMDIKNVLLAKGYTIAQLDAWDDRAQYTLDQSLFWAYTEGGAPRGDNETANFKRFDRAAQFQKQEPSEIAISINGAMVAPGATGDAASVGSGCLNMDAGTLGINAGTTFGLKSQRRDGFNQYGDEIQPWD